MTYAPIPGTTVPPGCRCPQCRYEAWTVAMLRWFAQTAVATLGDAL
jgi:hypothetical protein